MSDDLTLPCFRSWFGPNHTSMGYHNVTCDRLFFKRRTIITNSNLFENGKEDHLYKRMMREPELIIKDLADFQLDTPESLFTFLTDYPIVLNDKNEREMLLTLTTKLYRYSSKNSSAYINSDMSYKIASFIIDAILFLFHPYYVSTNMEDRFIQPVNSQTSVEMLLHKYQRFMFGTAFENHRLYINTSRVPYVDTCSRTKIAELLDLLKESVFDMFYEIQQSGSVSVPTIGCQKDLHNGIVCKEVEDYPLLPYFLCTDVAEYGLSKFMDVVSRTGVMIPNILKDVTMVETWWISCNYKENKLEQQRYKDVVKKMSEEVKEWYRVRPDRDTNSWHSRAYNMR